MRIAFVVNSFPTLSETFILDQITGLIDLGHDVHIFATPPTQAVDHHPEIERLDLMNRTTYHPRPVASKGLRRGQAMWYVLRTCPRVPLGTMRLVARQLSRPREFDYPRFLLWLSVLRGRFDVIHCHFGPNGLLMLPLKQAWPYVPLVTTFHGYDIRMALRDDVHMYAPLFRQADLLMANSEYTRGVLNELGAPAGRVCVHPPGVDLDYYRPAGRSPRDDASRPLYLVTVGRLVEEKGLEHGLRAVARFRQLYPDCRFQYDIVGFGSQEALLRAMIEDLALSPHVRLRGYMTRPQVLATLQEADIFLLPSIAEGLGVVLLEAQAVGVPIVASDVQGIPHAVDPGRSAFLVPPGDAEALAEALRRLAQDPPLREHMGRAGREFVRKHYDLQALNRRLVQTYQDLTTRKRKSPLSRSFVNGRPSDADHKEEGIRT
jgi:colanic acid/amylovoran biosynthesis glycosyltransferase